MHVFSIEDCLCTGLWTGQGHQSWFQYTIIHCDLNSSLLETGIVCDLGGQGFSMWISLQLPCQLPALDLSELSLEAGYLVATLTL